MIDRERDKMATKMFREERLRKIMEIAYLKKKVIVKDLAEHYDRSPASIRLDLAELESRGMLVRTHGGAILAEAAETDFVFGKNFLNKRVLMNKTEKKRIAEAVVELIHDGDSVMIDGGSTTFYVAESLKAKHGLTFVTTSLHLLPSLMENSDAKIYMTGGLIHRDFQDLIGEISVDSLQRFTPDCAIMGIDAFSIDQGFTTTEPAMAQIKKNMISVCKKAIIVVDSSKYGKTCLFHVANLKDVHAIITDKKVPDELKKYFEGIDTKFICV
jgi:DeoR/GlpR family transcriptional regulator of sugar metabolism